MYDPGLLDPGSQVKKVPVGDNKVWLRDMVREVKTFERFLALPGGA